MTPSEWIGTLSEITPTYPRTIDTKKAIGMKDITIKFAVQRALRF